MRPEEIDDAATNAVAGRGPVHVDGALTVMVVDGQPVFGEALAVAINAAPKLSCVAVAPDAHEAERLAAETQPDVVVMDLGLDGTDLIAATRSLRKSNPGTRVLVLTGQSPDAPLVRAASEAGASALLTKASSLSVVVDTISSLTEDCFTLDKTTVRELCQSSPTSSPPRASQSAALLTRREQNILDLLARGVDLQTGSVRLGITVNTARGYVKNLYRKLGVHNQLELLAVARETGLLEPPE